MKAVADQFYCSAIQTNVHAFIEFAGLMNEFIQICAQSPGFQHANTHNGIPLQMGEVHAAYLAEKLDCIYGPSLRKLGITLPK